MMRFFSNSKRAKSVILRVIVAIFMFSISSMSVAQELNTVKKKTVKQAKKKRATIQNRFAEKNGTYFFHVAGATHIRNDFYSVFGVGLDMGYYFYESLGFEIRGLYLESRLSEPAIDLKNRTGLTPDTYPQWALLTAGGRYSFGYGKVLAFDSFIVHFDPQFFLSGGVALAERRVIPTVLYGFSLLNHFKWGVQLKLDLAGSVQFEKRTDRGTVTSFGFMPLIGIGWSSSGLQKKSIPREKSESSKRSDLKKKQKEGKDE